MKRREFLASGSILPVVGLASIPDVKKKKIGILKKL
jgi:hypothetical protein